MVRPIGIAGCGLRIINTVRSTRTRAQASAYSFDMPLPIFIDIDGTLTTVPGQKWGPVLPERLAILRALIASGREVVLWSGGGSGYARAFAVKYDLTPTVCIGKPDIVVDDNPTIRPLKRMKIVAPEAFFKETPPRQI